MFLLKDLPNNQILSKFAKEYSIKNPDEVLSFLGILRIGSEYLELLDNFLKPYGLTHGRWITLILLKRRGNQQALPSELAEQQGITRATMSGLLNQLESQSFIKRIEVDNDKRKCIIALTKEGDSLLEKIMPEYYSFVSSVFKNLNTGSLKQLNSILGTLLENIE